MSNESKCPVTGQTGTRGTHGTSNRDWWPNQLNLEVLHQHCPIKAPPSFQ